MAEKTTTKRFRKVAIIQLDPPDGLEEMEEGAQIEIENWPEDGLDNIIPIGRAYQCSIHLANRLKRAGRIKSYTIQTVEV